MPLIESSGSSGGGGGSGTVTNVSSADTSIVVTNPTTTPSLKVGTMDVLFTNEPPAASVPMNTQKLTGLAAGTGAGDSVRFEQALKSGAVTAADTSIVVAGTGVAPTIATGTLDVIATNHPPAASVPMNAKKITGLAVATAGTDAASLANTLDQFGAPAANVAFGTHKITGLSAGSAAGDSVRFEQASLVAAFLATDATAITSNTTLANITGLSFAVTASGVFLWDWFIVYTAGTTADIKITFTAPAAATGGFSPVSTTNVSGFNQSAATANQLNAFAAGLGFGGGGVNIGNVQILVGYGIYVGGGNSGTIQAQAAQNTSDPAATTVRAGSMLRVWQAS